MLYIVYTVHIYAYIYIFVYIYNKDISNINIIIVIFSQYLERPLLTNELRKKSTRAMTRHCLTLPTFVLLLTEQPQ